MAVLEPYFIKKKFFRSGYQFFFCYFFFGKNKKIFWLCFGRFYSKTSPKADLMRLIATAAV